jgi:hypothetical protein
MEWLRLALENPQENWLVWAVFAYAMARIVWGSLGVMLSMSKNTNQDNATLLRFMDEMAQWRNLFQKNNDKTETFHKELIDLYKNSLVRIDATTQATLQNTVGLGQSGEKSHKKLVSIESYLKRLHKILEEKKVIP